MGACQMDTCARASDGVTLEEQEIVTMPQLVDAQAVTQVCVPDQVPNSIPAWYTVFFFLLLWNLYSSSTMTSCPHLLALARYVVLVLYQCNRPPLSYRGRRWRLDSGIWGGQHTGQKYIVNRWCWSLDGVGHRTVLVTR